jgi:hypothetical protein
MLGSMRRRVWSAIAPVAFGYALLGDGSALASYAAIAWNRESGKTA